MRVSVCVCSYQSLLTRSISKRCLTGLYSVFSSLRFVAILGLK